jgi:hypothetical protein
LRRSRSGGEVLLEGFAGGFHSRPRRRLNTAIRDALRATGRLGADQLDIDTPGGPRGYSTGDQVNVTRNDPSRVLLSGDGPGDLHL